MIQTLEQQVAANPPGHPSFFEFIFLLLYNIFDAVLSPTGIFIMILAVLYIWIRNDAKTRRYRND